MKLYQHDYKGKWFVLGDEPDDMYGDIGTVDSEDVDLIEHADNCLYYGIPMYVGKDEDFRARCVEEMDEAERRDIKEYYKSKLLEVVEGKREDEEINPETGYPYYSEFNKGWVAGTNKTVDDIKQEITKLMKDV